MNHDITRAEAIQLLCCAEVSRLTPKQRAEQLTTTMGEDWSSHPDWQNLPEDIQFEFTHEHLSSDPASSRYDSVLLLTFSYRYRGATNDFLLNQLLNAQYPVTHVEGEVEALFPCPCCGYCTLDERGGYDICPICWWEDDGQDNHDADEIRGGPNAALSLTQARINVLKVGISEPYRQDLRLLQEPESKYVRGRIFELRHNDNDELTIQEFSAE